MFLYICNKAVIYAGFLGEGVHQLFGGPIFGGRNEILILGKGVKFRVIFQKYALKLINIWKIIEKIWEKCNIFRNFFKFSRGTMGK